MCRGPNARVNYGVCLSQLLRMSPQVPMEDRPAWERNLHGPALVQAFQRECHIVRKVLDGDLIKV